MGQNWAIAVGINGYKNLKALHFAQRDAAAVRDYLRDELGCRPEQVYYFSDDSPPIVPDVGPLMDSVPTFATLKRFLRVRFEQPFLNPGDNLWFFFAGHGVRHEDRDYLLPIDADPGDVASTAIPLHYVTERLQRCGADNVILLVDACRSEGRRAGLGVGQERQPGVVSLFACSPQESSYEIEALEHGAFTYALLQGLRLQGEGNCATVERLYHYLSQTVPRLNAEHGKPRQTPYGRIEPPTKNSLILLPRQATLADVKELRYCATNAEVRGNYPLAKQFWIRVLAVSPADPEAIEGIERLVRGKATPPMPLPDPPAPPRAQPTPPTAPVPAPPSTARGTPAAAPPAAPRPQPTAPAPRPQPAVPPSTSRSQPPAVPPATPAKPRPKPIAPSPPPATSTSQSRPLPALGQVRLSRRRVIQILGFTGGGIGTVWLGRALLQLNNWKLPDLQPATTTGTTAEFNVATVNIQTKSITVERKRAEFRTEDLGGGVTLDLMVIPGGTFTMGSPENEEGRRDNEGPQREVTVPPFLMGKYAVTQAQWRVVAALPKVARDLNADPSSFKGDNRPVEQVSWDEAVEFCQRLTKKTGREYRLPSEAEWEYACRAGTQTPFHVGETITTDLANYNGNYTYGSGPKGGYREQTTEVGKFPANAFGLYDMHGNVWEWCEDVWHDNYDGAPTDGSAWITGNSGFRLLRGGSWSSNPRSCRSACRIRYQPDFHYHFLGFRLACSAAGT